MIEYFLLVIGILFLIKGADFLVEGASSLAKKLKISTLVIGLTIVALGTSMPELIVTIISALKGTGQVAFGNIIGSNMANTLLVLGLAALITNLKVKRSTTWKEIPFSLLAVIVLFVFFNRYFLDKIYTTYLLRTEGIILLLFFFIFIYYAIEISKKHTTKKTYQKTDEKTNKKIEIKKHTGPAIFAMITAGLLGLFFGGKWTVNGAVSIAQSIGISEFLISATIISIGTSLPELITSIVAALKKDIDLAVGNAVGSNIFNIFWVLGIAAIIKPIEFPIFAFFDLIMLLFVTIILFIFLFVGKKHELEKWQGGLFILLYLAYIAFLIMRG